MPAEALENLAARSDVQWIEEVRPIKLCDDVAYSPVVWMFLWCGPIWLLTGQDQIIGHADTGLDTGNLDTILTDFGGG